jgi:peptide chain release factor subunit 1
MANDKDSKYDVKRSSSLELFKMRRLLDSLAAKEGRHTELITLYIPPDRQLSDVMNNLREERGTASNIKSRTTRHNVEDAIEKVTQRLRLFKSTPPLGVAIFCGAIPYGPPGSEKMEIYVIEPPEKINVYFYRCDSRFHLDPLFEMIREKETFGIMVIDGSGATYATLKGKRLDVIKSINSGIASKHRAGGQSARRFERLRDVQVNEFYKRAAGYANQIFLGVPELKGVIVGGPGPTKEAFINGDYVHYNLKDKILGVFDTSYIDEQGVKEIVAKSPEILKGVRYVEERNFVQEFLRELGQSTGVATYGVDEIKRQLNAGLVKILLVSEKLDGVELKVRCSGCGYVKELSMRTPDFLKYESDLSGKPCPKCNNKTLEIVEKKDMIDVLTEMAEQANVQVEVISAAHEEGEMLLKSFGGAAAILRYSG